MPRNSTKLYVYWIRLQDLTITASIFIDRCRFVKKINFMSTKSLLFGHFWWFKQWRIFFFTFIRYTEYTTEDLSSGSGNIEHSLYYGCLLESSIKGLKLDVKIKLWSINKHIIICYTIFYFEKCVMFCFWANAFLSLQKVRTLYFKICQLEKLNIWTLMIKHWHIFAHLRKVRLKFFAMSVNPLVSSRNSSNI
jgi:hypothetical protein